ncbi:MAG TPA: tetratricopeptide repeat protein, partial [Tepidisphaeraceae bacterium]|nr:tetratricopeptide repeat protein [Tepidisphaeraceae bacterium]
MIKNIRMTPRPIIFISAVSKELKGARQLVANTLQFIGYEPAWQDIFGTEQGDLREMLRHQIDQCDGVVQLVGKCYGAEPPEVDKQFGRVSYTQYEAMYARRKDKKVWYLVVDDHFVSDPHEPESPELQQLQETYRRRLAVDSHLYHSLSSNEALEARILKLRDELAVLRRGVKRWAIAVAALLVVIVGMSAWLVLRQQQTSKKLQENSKIVQDEMDKMRQAVVEFAATQAQARQQTQDPAAAEAQTYDVLAKKLNVDAKTLREKLPQLAEQLRENPDASTYERANAAYVGGDFVEAERLAVQAANEAQASTPPKPAEAIKAFTLAGWSAQRRVDFPNELQYFQEAAKLTDRNADPRAWADAQHSVSTALLDLGNYRDCEHALQDVIAVRQTALGPEHADTLMARANLANVEFLEGDYAGAERTYRAVLTIQQRVLGPMNPDTLYSRNGLAGALG